MTKLMKGQAQVLEAFDLLQRLVCACECVLCAITLISTFVFAILTCICSWQWSASAVMSACRSEGECANRKTLSAYSKSVSRLC